MNSDLHLKDVIFLWFRLDAMLPGARRAKNEDQNISPMNISKN